MNMELTKKQERGFELLIRAIKKKFPYVLSVDIPTDIKGNDYFFWLNLTVEFTRFLNFYNVQPSEYHIKYGVENSKEYFGRDGTGSYPLLMVSSESMVDFGTEFNEKMQNFISHLYAALPNDYAVNTISEYDFLIKPKEFVIHKYRVEVDVNGKFPEPIN